MNHRERENTKTQKHKNKIVFLLSCFLAFLLFCVLAIPTHAASALHTYPKRANFFLTLNWRAEDVTLLAKWDVVVLNVEQQALHPEYIRKLRELNPRIRILAYMPVADFPGDVEAAKSVYPVRYKMWVEGLESGRNEAWFIHRANGTRVTQTQWVSNYYLLNISDRCPSVHGRTWRQYLARFMVTNVLATGLWDGIFYDNTWDNITYFAGSDIDFDNDHVFDTQPDLEWRAGLTALFNETRTLFNRDIILVGNNDTLEYARELNGMLLENFSNNWIRHMERFAFNVNTRREPRYNIINETTNNQGKQTDYARMRYGLASTLLEDGYYAFDFGDRDHGQLWWYDEYGTDLGVASGKAYTAHGAQIYTPDIWLRPFEHGLAVVNSTNQKQLVVLGADYEKIRGSQDPVTNDGSIVSEVDVASKDGLILVKPVTTLLDVPYVNGNFVRFFYANGKRARNGLYLFNPSYPGGATIAQIDISGDGKRDVLVVSKSEVSAWRDDGQLLFKLYPYTASYGGSIRVAIGAFGGDGQPKVIVAPGPVSAGSPVLPVKIYSRYGVVEKQWYPFGSRYRGGIHVALAHGGVGDRLVVGAGTGMGPLIQTYDATLHLRASWYAFERQFLGGVSVTAGDLNGDGKDEIIAGAGLGKKPLIRTYTQTGVLTYPEFSAYTSLGKPGIDVLTADVDFDGHKEIVGMSASVGI